MAEPGSEPDQRKLAQLLHERTCLLQAERVLRREAEERLHSFVQVFQTTSEGMYITDAAARLVEVNPAYCAIMGRDRADLLGRRAPELHGIDGGEQDAMIWEALREHGHWSGEVWERRPDGKKFPKWSAINVVRERGSGALKHYIGVFSDISSLRWTEEKLKQLAYHDALTGLLNRNMYRDRLGQELAACRRHQQRLAVLFVDLDRFKIINDTYGHEAGDALLIEVAAALRQVVREGDIVARFGGDEFLLALRNIRDPQAVEQVAAKLVLRLAQPFTVAGRSAYGGASVGIALYPDDGSSTDELIRHADAAMYSAKSAGRGTYRFYTPEIERMARNDLLLKNEMRAALERGEFLVHYQPQWHVASGRLVGAEALLRWQHPQQGLILPSHFIPLAEETGHIIALGHWVMRQACRQLAQFEAAAGAPLTMAINLSPRQFQQADLVADIVAIAQDEGVHPSSIELEVTESTAMADVEAAAVTLQELAMRGFGIAIDDFGTGYSSLAYLRRFPVDKLKIDRSFVCSIPEDVNDAVIASAVIRLGKSLGLRVVAEGVENEIQRNFLAAQGCDFLQGYGYGYPMTPAAFIACASAARIGLAAVDSA